ncbi:unnamed protein product [Lupinus luteus]|uniref:Uncharacterized protein n=1 Tax=Lupinus luteus TaxID=3873 RepID=A0AAV1VX14_LUPLU
MDRNPCSSVSRGQESFTTCFFQLLSNNERWTYQALEQFPSSSLLARLVSLRSWKERASRQLRQQKVELRNTEEKRIQLNLSLREALSGKQAYLKSLSAIRSVRMRSSFDRSFRASSYSGLLTWFDDADEGNQRKCSQRGMPFLETMFVSPTRMWTRQSEASQRVSFLSPLFKKEVAATVIISAVRISAKSPLTEYACLTLKSGLFFLDIKYSLTKKERIKSGESPSPLDRAPRQGRRARLRETDSQAESEVVLSSVEIKAGKGRSSQVRLPTPWVVNHIRGPAPLSGDNSSSLKKS